MKSNLTLAGRKGFTLVELLIALTIASVLTAIALPSLKDSLRQNSLSRAASLVKGAFLNARANAVQTGRPYGIVIERRRKDIGSGAISGLNFVSANYSTRMYYVQSPLEYRGDINEAAAYPVIGTDQVTSSAGTQNFFAPRFFVPIEFAGLLYAAAARNGSPAERLIGAGTRFSINDSEYVFEITALTQGTLAVPGVSTAAAPSTGTFVEFNYRDASPRFGFTPGQISTTRTNVELPMNLNELAPYQFKFRTNPLRASAAPVNMIGRTVIDLSISGPSNDPLAFNSQAIIDATPESQAPTLSADTFLNDVLVMFAPDGRLDGVYSGQRFVNSGAITRFDIVRSDPSTTVSFNVGFVDGLLDNIDDGARYPDLVGTTDYQVTTGDPPLAPPGQTAALTPNQVPNFANTDCAWISIQPLSGSVRLDNVASQPDATRLTNYYGLSATPFARQVVIRRVHQSRRLNSAGSAR